MEDRFGPGDVLDRYELVERIGSGGMGSVWLAIHRGAFGFRRPVAVKMMLPKLANQQHYRKMVCDEAHVMSRLRHPNIAQVLDLGEHDGAPFLVLEWLDGLSLQEVLDECVLAGKEVPTGLLLRIATDTAAGVHAAHELRDEHGTPLRIVHRDISPNNILIDAAGSAKVIDFGIARWTQREATATKAGMVKGKQNYLSPEQAMRFEVDRRADIWGIGATLYRALSGRAPFTSMEALVSFVEGRTEVPALDGRISSVVRAIVTRALAVEPKHRFQSADEMRLVLEETLASIPGPKAHADVGRFVADLREARKALAFRLIGDTHEEALDPERTVVSGPPSREREPT